METLEFPTVAVPDPPVEARITLSSFGDVPVILGEPVVVGGSEFRVDDSGCAGSPLEVFEYCELSVFFDPTSPGMHAGRLEIHSNAEDAPHTVFLSGTASGSRLVFRSRGNFGPRGPGGSMQRQVSLHNWGPDPATPSLQITGSDAGAFRVYDNQCTSMLPAGSSCLVGIEFTALRAGLHSAKLEATASSAPVPAYLDLLVSATPARPPGFPPPVNVDLDLAIALHRSATAWRDRARPLLRGRGFAASFRAPAAGTLRLGLRRAGRLVARGASQGGPGRLAVRARPTRFGRRLLQRRRALALSAKLVFAAASGPHGRADRVVRLRAVRR